MIDNKIIFYSWMFINKMRNKKKKRENKKIIKYNISILFILRHP